MLLKENKPHEIIAKLRKNQFQCEILCERKIRGEELYILKFVSNIS